MAHIIILDFLYALNDVPGKRRRKDSPLDILQKRFASGQITKEEYGESKKIVEKDSAKQTG